MECMECWRNNLPRMELSLASTGPNVLTPLTRLPAQDSWNSLVFLLLGATSVAKSGLTRKDGSIFMAVSMTVL